VPVWRETTKRWVEQEKLVVLGIVQEQHPRRCQLFAQWQQLDWPILVDPINVMGCGGVPILVAIDEHGIVRSVRPRMETFERDFLLQEFPLPAAGLNATHPKATVPDLAALRSLAQRTPSGDTWRRLGDALALWGGDQRINEAVDAYTRAVGLAADDGDAHFRLGVCYRMRYDSPQRKPGDFQAAVKHWSAARSTRPNQYIWRRRIEQYGPRLTKPYPFFDWVTTAKTEIADRGDEPVTLMVEPSGAEIAHPSREFAVDPGKLQSPDPQGRIDRDLQGLIVAEVAVVPPRISPGGISRVHVTLRPRPGDTVHWNNESQPLVLWIDPPQGWQVQQRRMTAPPGNKPETVEPRHLEFEVRAPRDAVGVTKLPAYALYYVCEDDGGTCLFLRQDLKIAVKVEE
jgi:hypothetical protein